MNVCSVIYRRPDITPDGTCVVLWKISSELAKLGCNIHIVFISPKDHYPSEFTVNSIYFHSIGAQHSNSIIEKLTFMKLGSQKLEEIEKKFGIDIFSFHGPASLPLLFYFRKKSRKPFIYHTYAALPFEMQTYLLDSSTKSLLLFLRKLLMYTFYIPLEFIALKYIEGLIVPTFKTIEEFKRCYRLLPSSISVVPLGQDIFDRYQSRISGKLARLEDKKVLLFVGNDWYRKGVWYLLLAFAVVHKKIPNTLLVLTGPPQVSFISLAKRLKIIDSIIFAGNPDEETLAKLYASCDIFVLPSFHEGFSQTIVEAMAFAKPVVTTPIAGYPVVTSGQEGFIIPPADYKAIATSIITLLKNEWLYQKMSHNAFKKAKKYTWEKSAKKILAIYQNYKNMIKNEKV
ncbi:MAG: glycosyltransferase family 4 protein [Nitrososphaeria archaeon]